PATFGQPVTFTATVSVVAPDFGLPSGTVSFMDGATTIGTASIVMDPNTLATTASFTTSSLGVGGHSITAVFAASPTFNGSTSAALTETINPAASKTVLTTSNTPSLFGVPITLKATVTPLSGGGVPTGSVVFKDGATTIGTVALSAGAAQLNTSTLAIGSHSIIATYSGRCGLRRSSSTQLSPVSSPAPD